MPVKVKQLYALDCRKRPTGVAVSPEWTRAMGSPTEAAEVFRAFTEEATQESLLAIFVDNRHRPIAFAEVARGTGNAVSVKPGDVLTPALAVGATALLIAHHHPSGMARPSADDVDLTRRLKAAGDLVGVPLLDHLVIGANTFHSFANECRAAETCPLWGESGERMYDTRKAEHGPQAHRKSKPARLLGAPRRRAR